MPSSMGERVRYHFHFGYSLSHEENNHGDYTGGIKRETRSLKCGSGELDVLAPGRRCGPRPT